jgi:Flavin containing amine oxidoreductase
MANGAASSKFSLLLLFFFSPLHSRGSSTLPVTLAGAIRGNITFGQSVNAIVENEQNEFLTVKTEIGLTKDYAAVISTVTLGCLSTIDLSTCGIAGYNYPQWSAIRELQYGPAIKIGVRWDKPWWQDQIEFPIVGGQSFTDLPLRTMLVVSRLDPGDSLIGLCAVSIPHTPPEPRNLAPSLLGRCEQGIALDPFLHPSSNPTATAGLRTQSV